MIDAVHKGHAVGHEQDGVAAVRAALSAGGDVNERDKAGWTQLMHAALECRSQIAKVLLDAGINPLLKGNEGSDGSFMNSGQTALTVAASCFIARRRAQLGPERHMPASYVDYELNAPAILVDLLIRHGADVNAPDAYGRTPLMMAVAQGWKQVMTDLLSAGASINARDREGRLAIDYADPTDRQSVALLISKGSKPSTGRSGRTVCDAERSLDQAGYDTPIIDCIEGQQLRAKVIQFQQRVLVPLPRFPGQLVHPALFEWHPERLVYGVWRERLAEEDLIGFKNRLAFAL